MDDLCQIEREISLFYTRIFGTLETLNILQATYQGVPNMELFLEEKITKCEQCTIETLIRNSLARERVFYCLNE